MCRFLLPLVLAFVLSGHSGNRSLKLAGSGKKNGVVRSVGQHRQPRLAYLRCIMARRQRLRLSSRKSWITRAPIGAVSGNIPTGDSSIRSPIWGGARLRACRHSESQKGVPGLLRILEGRRPRHPYSSAS